MALLPVIGLDAGSTLSPANAVRLGIAPARLSNLPVTAALTIAPEHAASMLHVTAATAVTVTVTTMSPGTVVSWRQFGAGQVSFVAGTGITLRGRSSAFRSAGQYAEGYLTWVDATTVLVGGDVTPTAA